MQSHEPDSHPTEEQLLEFVHGRLAAPHLEQVGAHLEQCKSCLERLGQLPADTLVDQIGELDSMDDFSVANEISSSDAAEWLQRHPKYRLIRQLGSGGMGEVFLAEHQMMARKVAVKAIRPEYFQNAVAISRFQNEVRAAALLAHPNIVVAHDAEEFEGHHFLVMEFVDGQSLRERVAAKGPLSVRRACSYAIQVARGLRHAHQQNMVHRDIKPSNLMTTSEGVIKILDFGLAKATQWQSEERATSTGTMMGTADFVAPEQARDAKTADIRSDLYSLGCTLFFMLAGQAPFSGDNRLDKAFAHCNQPFPSIRSIRPDVPTEFEDVIFRLCAKQPGDRFQTPAELIDALRPLGAKADASAKPDAKDHSLTSVEDNKQPVADTVRKSTAATTMTAPLPTSNPSATESAGNEVTSRKKFLLWAIGSLLLGGLLLGWFFWDRSPAPSITPEGGSDGKPTALLVVSSEKFWFGDFGPIHDRLTAAGVRVWVASDQAGVATYDRTDRTSGRRDVEIDFAINQLDQDRLDQVDAIVFMGNQVSEFVADDVTGSQLRTVLEQLSGKAWIASVGRGNLIPLHYDRFDGVAIASSKWIMEEVEQHPLVQPSDDPIVVDANRKIITGRDWHHADAFAARLAQLLQ